MSWRAVLAIGLCLSLSGCIAFQSKATRTSPAFRAGYSDGCAAGGGGGATIRVEDAEAAAGYRGDRRYRSGYSAGVAGCRPSSQRPGSMLERGPVADPYPGLPK